MGVDLPLPVGGCCERILLLEGIKAELAAVDKTHLWEVVLFLILSAITYFRRELSSNRVYMQHKARAAGKASADELDIHDADVGAPGDINISDKHAAAAAAAAAASFVSDMSPSHLKQLLISSGATVKLGLKLGSLDELLRDLPGRALVELSKAATGAICRSNNRRAACGEGEGGRQDSLVRWDERIHAELGRIAPLLQPRLGEGQVQDGKAVEKVIEHLTAMLHEAQAASAASAGNNRAQSTSSSCLLDTPQDVTLHVMSYLQPQELLQLAQVSRGMRAIADSETVWRQRWLDRYGAMWEAPALQAILARRHLHALRKPADVKPPHGQTWKEFYFRFEEGWVEWLIAGCNAEDNCLVGMNGKVYDLSEFLPHHPGSRETILVNAGSDATVFFEDVGHSYHARSLMKDFLLLEPRQSITRCRLVSLGRRMQQARRAVLEGEPLTATSSERAHGGLVRALVPVINNLSLTGEDSDGEFGDEADPAGVSQVAKAVRGFCEACGEAFELLPVRGGADDGPRACPPQMHEGVMRAVHDPFTGQWMSWWSCCALVHAHGPDHAHSHSH